MSLQPMSTLPRRLEVLIKLKPGIPVAGASPLPPWIRARTYDGFWLFGKSPDVRTHLVRDCLGWAPLTHIVDGFRAEW